MLLLTLIRHARAGPNVRGRGDFGRPLNQSGWQDGQAVAAWWAQQPSQPDLYLVSSAQRAHETAKVLIPATSKAQLELEPRLYEASSDMILSILAEYDGRYNHIAVIGHNPSISAAAYSLCGNKVPVYLPTLGLVHYRLAALSWSDLTAGAELIVSMTPKQLRESSALS